MASVEMMSVRMASVDLDLVRALYVRGAPPAHLQASLSLPPTSPAPIESPARLLRRSRPPFPRSCSANDVDTMAAGGGRCAPMLSHSYEYDNEYASSDIQKHKQ